MRNADHIRAYYTRLDVVDQYLDHRFASPAGGFHNYTEQQLAKKYLSGVKRVIEIACGPVRFGNLVRRLEWSYLGMDISIPMLQQAHRRWPELAFTQTDAFTLPLTDQATDAVLTMRFIRHFTYPDRQQIYREIHRILQPGGWFVFDACNEARHQHLINQRPIYDELYTESELKHELEAHNFKLRQLSGYIYQEDAIIRYLKGAARRFWAWGWTVPLHSVYKLHYKYERSLSLHKSPLPYLWLVLCQKTVS